MLANGRTIEAQVREHPFFATMEAEHLQTICKGGRLSDFSRVKSFLKQADRPIAFIWFNPAKFPSKPEREVDAMLRLKRSSEAEPSAGHGWSRHSRGDCMRAPLNQPKSSRLTAVICSLPAKKITNLATP